MELKLPLVPFEPKAGSIYTITSAYENIFSDTEMVLAYTVTCDDDPRAVMKIAGNRFFAHSFSGELVRSWLSDDWEFEHYSWWEDRWYEPPKREVLTDKNGDPLARLAGLGFERGDPLSLRARYGFSIELRTSPHRYHVAYQKAPPWQMFSPNWNPELWKDRRTYICDEDFQVLLQFGSESDNRSDQIHVVAVPADFEVLFSFLVLWYPFPQPD